MYGEFVKRTELKTWMLYFAASDSNSSVKRFLLDQFETNLKPHRPNRCADELPAKTPPQKKTQRGGEGK